MTLIIALQVLGGTYEITLISRLKMLNMLPSKEFVVLVSALLLEVTRMFLVDAYVLQEFFGGDAYRVFREPADCDEFGHDCWLGKGGNKDS